MKFLAAYFCCVVLSIAAMSMEVQARSFFNVASAMLNVIPMEEIEIRKYFEKNLLDFCIAPELRWQRLQSWLNGAIPRDNLNEWQQLVVDIFINKINYKIYLKNNACGK